MLFGNIIFSSPAQASALGASAANNGLAVVAGKVGLGGSALIRNADIPIGAFIIQLTGVDPITDHTAVGAGSMILSNYTDAAASLIIQSGAGKLVVLSNETGTWPAEPLSGVFRIYNGDTTGTWIEFNEVTNRTRFPSIASFRTIGTESTFRATALHVSTGELVLDGSIFYSSGATVGAVTADILTIPIPGAGGIRGIIVQVQILISVVGGANDGNMGVQISSYGGKIKAGVVTEIGAAGLINQMSKLTEVGIAGVAFALVISGTNLILRATGVAANNLGYQVKAITTQII